MKYIILVLIISFFYRPGFARDPASPADNLWNEAISALEARQYRNAQKLFEDFVKRHAGDPRATSARVYVAVCDYNIGGRTQRALDVWNRVVSMEMLQKRASPALLLSFEQLLAHYRTEKRMGDWKKTLDQALSVFPGNPEITRELRLFARQCINNGDWSEALSALSRIEQSELSGRDREDLMLARAMSETDGNASVLVKAANDRLEQDNLSLAVRLYNEALRRNPGERERLEAMTKLGWCFYLQQQYKDAESLWQQVVRQGGKGDEWVGRSRWHIIQLMTGPLNNTARAIELCDVQAREFPGSFRGQQAMFTKAWIYWQGEDWSNALKAFRDLIKDYPHVASHAPIKKYISDCEEGLQSSRAGQRR